MKILSLYFSATNNTEYVEKQIVDYLNKKNKDITVDSFNVISDDIKSDDLYIEQYDLYLIGGPVYIEVLPHKLVHFIKDNFKKGNHKKVVLYFTAANDTPPALYGLYRYLTQQEYDIVSVVGFAMINNYYMSGHFDYTEIDKRKTLLNLCKIKSEKIAETILRETETYYDASLNKLRYYIGATVYNMLKNNFIANYAKKNFQSSIKCVGCGICEKECPTNNITVNNKENLISFNNKCYACTRCIHICHKNAIHYKNKEIRKMNMLK